MKTRNRQLAPLKKRINLYQQEKRQMRIKARTTVAAMLIGQLNQMGMVLNHYFNRSFWGRMKFLLTGK